MANQFIGFPVPRARIADMIDDELAGAGYLSLPWEDAVHIIDFVSLDGLDSHTAGTGTITLNDDEVQVTADGANNDVARVKKELSYSEPVLTWSKNRSFSVRAALMSYGNANNHLRIGLGEVGVAKGFGFVVESNILKTYAYNGGLATPFEIEDWTAGAFNNQRILKAVREAANCLKFYVDGVLVHTETTHIPTGTTNAKIILKMEARNIGAGDLCRLALSTWNFWQEA